MRVSSLRSPAKAGAVSRAAGEEYSERAAFLEFFGLREQPFDQAPNPHYFYPSATHKEALASLLCGIESRRGFLGLIAEPGMGKTTLLYEVLQRLRTSARTAFVPQGQIEPGDLLRSLLADLEVDDPGRGFFQMHQQLNEILIREANSGRHLVLVIDEAQDLERPVLEMVRILSNFETPRAKLMEIVMAGEPALVSKLAQPALVQLRQRISLVGRLKPLSDAETAEYIDHRLHVAGYSGASLFTPEARALIAAQSEGVPREINTLCFNALSLGYSLGRRTIDVEDRGGSRHRLGAGSVQCPTPSGSGLAWRRTARTPTASPIELSGPLGRFATADCSSGGRGACFSCSHAPYLPAACCEDDRSPSRTRCCRAGPVCIVAATLLRRTPAQADHSSSFHRRSARFASGRTRQGRDED